MATRCQHQSPGIISKILTVYSSEYILVNYLSVRSLLLASSPETCLIPKKKKKKSSSLCISSCVRRKWIMGQSSSGNEVMSLTRIDFMRKLTSSRSTISQLSWRTGSIAAFSWISLLAALQSFYSESTSKSEKMYHWESLCSLQAVRIYGSYGLISK